MSVFEDVKIEWNKETRTIPSNRVLLLVAQVEEIVTFNELASFARRGSAPLAKIAMAYATMIRYAGFNGVTDDEVYEYMISVEQKDVISAVMSLMSVLIPKSAFKKTEPTEGVAVAAPGNRAERRKQSSSAKRTSRSSATGSSDLPSSGPSTPVKSGG